MFMVRVSTRPVEASSITKNTRLNFGGTRKKATDEQVHVRLASEDVDIADSSGGKRRVENVRRGKVDKEMKSCGHNGSNQSMKPTAPLRYKLSVFATTPCRGLSLSR